MRKLNSLRDHFTAALPELARNPDALIIYSDGGTIAARDGANLGFEMRYKATITFLDCRYAPAQLFLPLVIWLRTHQCDILQNHQTGTEGIRFRVDPIDNSAVDIEISLSLTEALDVLPDGAGGYTTAFRPEPPRLDQDALTDPLVLVRQIWGQTASLPPEFWAGHVDPPAGA